MRPVASLLVLGTVLAASAAGAVPLDGADRAALARIRDAFDRQLIDYPSARFKDARITRYHPFTVCGLINSRTRAGGYSGWTYFAAEDWAGGVVVTFTPEETGRTPEVMTYRTACLIAGTGQFDDISAELAPK